MKSQAFAAHAGTRQEMHENPGLVLRILVSAFSEGNGTGGQESSLASALQGLDRQDPQEITGDRTDAPNYDQGIAS